ncbi:MAG: DUF4268 domain-containing protein [Candidatus Poribacteria bacterium]|nr:DUF4268 domain-containing protein [Candidatus Poribacteria bacterium]
MNAVGHLQRVALREVWDNEPNDFTPWLEKNIDVLNDTIGLSISIVEREHRPTERLSVDLLGEIETETETGLVVIENQLEASNHDHLGKLITYLTVIDARVGIWIVADPKPEHVSAISWLNQTYAADFYLVKLEAVQIGDSLRAPLLTLIVGANEESKQAVTVKAEEKERYGLRQEFWTQLLDRARERTPLHANISAKKYASIYATVRSGVFLQYTIRQRDSGVGLYIDRSDKDENIEIFRALKEKKCEIEEAFGEPLEWEQRDGTRVCRIVKSQVSQGGYRNDREDWEEIQDSMIEAMIRLNKALEPHIEALG